MAHCACGLRPPCRACAKNTACKNSGCEDRLNSRYYLVLVQYTAKIFAHNIFRLVRGFKNPPLPRKQYHFRVANAQAAQDMTGFEFNAMAPVGLKDGTAIPLLVSHLITELPDPMVCLGGGDVDLKYATTPRG